MRETIVDDETNAQQHLEENSRREPCRFGGRMRSRDLDKHASSREIVRSYGRRMIGLIVFGETTVRHRNDGNLSTDVLKLWERVTGSGSGSGGGGDGASGSGGNSNQVERGVRKEKRETLSRRRRELTFPKGSAIVTTVALLKAIMVKEPSNWNQVFEFDVIWPIPSIGDLRKTRFKKPWKTKRRHKRELYANFESALNSQSLPGRQCVLRTICEARVLLSPPGLSFVEDALRVILSNSEDVEEIDCYDAAYRASVDCDLAYPCPFSLLHLLLYNLYS